MPKVAPKPPERPLPPDRMRLEFALTSVLTTVGALPREDRRWSVNDLVTAAVQYVERMRGGIYPPIPETDEHLPF